MQVTQNDLSYNLANLDFNAMLSTARIAVGHCIEESTQYLNKIRNSATSNTTCLDLNAEWLHDETRQLQIASETLATLIGAMNRTRIKVINKPKLKRS